MSLRDYNNMEVEDVGRQLYTEGTSAGLSAEQMQAIAKEVLSENCDKEANQVKVRISSTVEYASAEREREGEGEGETS